jgi:hypothetical protein
MFSMKTAPKTGQKLILLVGENEWSAIGYYDAKLGWVAEKHILGQKPALVKVKPVGWEPLRTAA